MNFVVKSEFLLTYWIKNLKPTACNRNSHQEPRRVARRKFQ